MRTVDARWIRHCFWPCLRCDVSYQKALHISGNWRTKAVTLVPLCLFIVNEQASPYWQCQAVARFKTGFSFFADCVEEAAVYPLPLLEALTIFIVCVWDTRRSRLQLHVPFFYRWLPVPVQMPWKESLRITLSSYFHYREHGFIANATRSPPFWCCGLLPYLSVREPSAGLANYKQDGCHLVHPAALIKCVSEWYTMHILLRGNFGGYNDLWSRQVWLI